MTEIDGDLVRLSVPAEEELSGVVEVAVGALARRCGVPEAAVTHGRAAAAAAFSELLGEAVEPTVEVEARLQTSRLDVRLRRGIAERSVTVPEVR